MLSNNRLNWWILVFIQFPFCTSFRSFSILKLNRRDVTWEVKYCISKFPEEKVFRSLNKQVAFKFWCECVKECSILDGFTKTQNLWTEPTWQLPQISTQKNKIFRILTLLNFPTLSVRWASSTDWEVKYGIYRGVKLCQDQKELFPRRISKYFDFGVSTWANVLFQTVTLKRKNQGNI